MALLQLLLSFAATDHGDCHFLEESLEKVTVPTSKRLLELSKSSNTRFTEFTEFARKVGRRRHAASLSAFCNWIGEF